MSAPTTPNSISISQSSASRPSRPFSPSPPRDNIHTASRPPSLFLGAADPSSPSLTGNRSFHILGLPDTPDSYKSSAYDGMPRHEISEDLFGYGDREIRGRRTSSRVGRPGEVDKTPAAAELATTRNSLSMVRSMSNGSISSSSSASPPLGSASILATLASDAEIPSIPPSSSRRLSGRSSGYSTPLPNANAPRSPNSAQTNRTSANPSSLSNSKSMPRLHQPTVVRSVSGKGVSFLPPPGRIVPSSSSSSLARSRTTKGSTSARSSLPAVAGDKEDRARRYYSFNGGESSRPKPNSYLSDLGPPIRFPTARAPIPSQFAGGNEEDKAAETMLQRGVIEVKQGDTEEVVPGEVPTTAPAVPYGIDDQGLPGLDHGSGATSDRSTTSSRGEELVELATEAEDEDHLNGQDAHDGDHDEIPSLRDTPDVDRPTEKGCEGDREAGAGSETDEVAAVSVPSVSPSPGEGAELEEEAEAGGEGEARRGDVPTIRPALSTPPVAEQNAAEQRLEAEKQTDPEMADLSRDEPLRKPEVGAHETMGADVSDPVWWVSRADMDGEPARVEEEHDVEDKQNAVRAEGPRDGDFAKPEERQEVAIGQVDPEVEIEAIATGRGVASPIPSKTSPIAEEAILSPDAPPAPTKESRHKGVIPSEVEVVVEDTLTNDNSILPLDKTADDAGGSDDLHPESPKPQAPESGEAERVEPMEALGVQQDETTGSDKEVKIVAGGAAGISGEELQLADVEEAREAKEIGAKSHVEGEETVARSDGPDTVVADEDDKPEEEESPEGVELVKSGSLPRVISQETILHEITDEEIDPSMLASIGDVSATSDSGMTVYVPPYQPRKPISNRTYRLPTPSTTAAEEDKFAVTLLAGIARQSRADALSLTIPHVELYLAWSEPRSWLWVPARKYIPAFDLRLVGSGKEVVLHDPAANERREQRQGLVRGVVRGVVGRLPIVWRFAGWV